MQYGLAFSYVTGRTGGWTNLLLITVCTLIPVLGPIVLLGYQAEVAVALLEDEDRRRHPKFTFDRFMEYLSRGVWPFLMNLVVSVVMIPIFIVAFVLAGVGAAAAPDAALLFIAIGYVVGIGAVLLVSIFAAPMNFHAGLAGKFDLGAAFKFAKSFWATVGVKAIVSWLVFFLLSMLVALVGLLACFIGIYPASALIQMASQHIMVQLYDEYLDRGGEAIELFVPPPPEEPRRRKRRERDRDEQDDQEERDERDERE